jgi:hypothetical protein
MKVVIAEITREVFEWYSHKPFPRRGSNLDEYMDDILDMLSPLDGPPLTKDRIVNIRRVYPNKEGVIQVAIKI